MDIQPYAKTDSSYCWENIFPIHLDLYGEKKQRFELKTKPDVRHEAVRYPAPKF